HLSSDPLLADRCVDVLTCGVQSVKYVYTIIIAHAPILITTVIVPNVTSDWTVPIRCATAFDPIAFCRIWSIKYYPNSRRPTSYSKSRSPVNPSQTLPPPPLPQPIPQAKQDCHPSPHLPSQWMLFPPHHPLHRRRRRAPRRVAGIQCLRSPLRPLRM